MAIRGLESLAEVLDLIKNPSKYEAKLKEIQDQVAKYTEVIESVTKLSEVNEYTLNIREKSAKADKLLADAQVSAAKIQADAKESADKDREEAKVILTKAKERDKISKDKEAFLNKALDDLAAGQKGLAEDKARLSIKEQELADLAKELEDRRQRLLAAMK